MCRGILVAFTLVAIILVGFYANGDAVGEVDAEADAMAEVLLSDIRDNMGVLKRLEEVNITDDQLRSMIIDSMLRKIMLLRVVPYDINGVRGRALETLCLLSEGKPKEWVMQSSDAAISELAVAYIGEIEEAARSRIERLQETMRGSGCYLTLQE